MRARGFILSAVLATIAASAFAGNGPPEQWLQYASSDQPSTTVGGTNGQQLKLTDKAPPGLALPKFKSDKPLFALWKVKLDNACPRVAADGGIWLAIDQSRKDGPYDLLYADAKAEGALAGASPVKAGDVSEDKTINYAYARFLHVRFTLPGPDGPAAYHAQFTYLRSKDERNIYVYSACWYEGPVTIDGRRLWCLVADNNANTRFDDSGTTRDACDRIRIVPPGEASQPGADGEKTTRYVGRYVEVGGKLHLLTVSPDGAFVQFAPAGTLAEGAIRAPEGVEQFAVFGPAGNFICKPVGGLARVPAGEYMLDNWRLARADAAEAIWRIGDRYNTAEKPVTVEPNQPADLDIGEPYVWEVTTGSGQSPREHSINVAIRARRRDTLTMTVNGNQPPPPKVHITSADGKYDRTFSMEYG